MTAELKRCWLQDDEEGYTLATVLEIKGETAICQCIKGERQVIFSSFFAFIFHSPEPSFYQLVKL